MPTKMKEYRYTDVRILRIVDGDTIDVEIAVDIGFRVVATSTQRLRLARINAPEPNSKSQKERAEATKASLLLNSLLIDPFAVTTYSPCEITTAKTDSFGRYIAEVWCNGKNVNDALLEAGIPPYK